MFSVYVALGVAIGVSIAMCSVPLLGVHGAESALLLGVVLPPFAAYGSAAIVRQYRRTPELFVNGGLSTLFARCTWFAKMLWLASCAVLGLDALRVRNCSPGEGLAFMVLGPGLGVVIAAFTGMFCALLLPRARFTPLLAAAIPVGTMLAAIWRFYAGPGIFAYGHYYGFFPGTLYDEGVSLTGSFWWLRVETVIWIAALALLMVSGTEPETLAWRPRPRPGYKLAFFVGVVCAALGCTAEYFSDELGNTTSSARVREALGGVRESPRCRLFFPREWAERDRRRISEDCDFRVQQAETWLGVTHPTKVEIYLFRSPAEKYALMGAESTNIAKPWRSEAYISEAGWPNPVLGHEVVHVVARAVGTGPLRISGSLGGLWPNPALIEGVAVASAWQPQGSLTPHEWAHAMLELNMIPPLGELFGASFLGQQKRLAYTLSGSLLRFVHERYGRKAVLATYSTGDLVRGVGRPLAEIERGWRDYLRSTPLAASSLALARARFSGGSILSAVCPHTLAKLRDVLRSEVNAGDDQSARKACDQILAVDPQDAGTRAALAALQARLGDQAGAAQELLKMQQLGAPGPYVAAVKQAFADQALREGRAAQALALYRELLAEPIEEDQKRQLQVKTLAASGLAAPSGESAGDPAVTQPRRQAELLIALLIGAPGEHADPATAVYFARELRNTRSDGLPIYLEARQLFFQARFELAAHLLSEARTLQLPTPELRAEALRIEAISRVATRELSTATNLFLTYRATGNAARIAEADDYLARIRFMSHAQ